MTSLVSIKPESSRTRALQARRRKRRAGRRSDPAANVRLHTTFTVWPARSAATGFQRKQPQTYCETPHLASMQPLGRPPPRANRDADALSTRPPPPPHLHARRDPHVWVDMTRLPPEMQQASSPEPRCCSLRRSSRSVEHGVRGSPRKASERDRQREPGPVRASPPLARTRAGEESWVRGCAVAGSISSSPVSDCLVAHVALPGTERSSSAPWVD